MSRRVLGLCLCLCTISTQWLWPGDSQAWVFHEHTEIGRAAFEQLNAEERALIADAWKAIRLEHHLQSTCDEGNWRATDDPNCVALPMLPAIAADHSCSPQDLLEILEKNDWIDDVVKVARKGEKEIKTAPNESARLEGWIMEHLRLQGADPKYLDRARAGSAHFLELAPRGANLEGYLKQALEAGAESNGLALYIMYHLAALRLAAEVKTDPRLTTLALLTETFAQHFLQDAFSAGHIVGNFGRDETRMGTHDYYCQHGIEVHPWSDPTGTAAYVAHGDAHMRTQDAFRSTQAVRDSWKQFAAALVSPASAPPLSLAQARAFAAFDVCSVERMPAGLLVAERAFAARLAPILAAMPRPSLAGGPPPRFVKEKGLFVAAFAGGGFDTSFGGYDNPSPAGVPTGSLNLAIGLGVGIEVAGIMSRRYDALYWVQARAYAAGQQARLDCLHDCDPLIGRRMALEIRLRAPYALVPGDGIIALPLALAKTSFGIDWALLEAQGGPLRLQSVITLWDSVSFQFVLGREIGLRLLRPAELALPGSALDGEVFDALQLDFPVFDFHPFRVFKGGLAQSLLIQLGWGLDLNDVHDAARIFIAIGSDARLYPGL